MASEAFVWVAAKAKALLIAASAVVVVVVVLVAVVHAVVVAPVTFSVPLALFVDAVVVVVLAGVSVLPSPSVVSSPAGVVVAFAVVPLFVVSDVAVVVLPVASVLLRVVFVVVSGFFVAVPAHGVVALPVPVFFAFLPPIAVDVFVLQALVVQLALPAVYATADPRAALHAGIPLAFASADVLVPELFEVVVGVAVLAAQLVLFAFAT